MFPFRSIGAAWAGSVCGLTPRGRSGWFAILTLLPFINWIVALMLVVIPGAKGEELWPEPARTCSPDGGQNDLCQQL
jgi:hypothetical protein